MDARSAGQAYVKSHIKTAIFVLDFLKHARARSVEEKSLVDELKTCLSRLHRQVGRIRTTLRGARSAVRVSCPLTNTTPTLTHR